ncbi:cupredoxin domain-containing protein [Anaeromyxobacter paludicola]|uniref:EfeO-type cupredoxin-like domain-containing protein n=1 Tax=Anaeromyxobacter paludicola TaxID=2918171 RepID=A0ABN6N3I7_9BACT|nr:cupredoxin domain-containing protein [Anaeromyxobacter paludicola]BDG07745.1 hypothetical protein AMPC_08580 [Anaeromyxobacter paludicola]
MRALSLVFALCLAAPALAADNKPGGGIPQGGVRREIKVTERGFEPREVTAKQGQPLTLVFTRTTDKTCITAIDIPDEQVKGFQLPLNKTVELVITPKKPGVERFHCSAMGMGNGKIRVE